MFSNLLWLNTDWQLGCSSQPTVARFWLNFDCSCMTHKSELLRNKKVFDHCSDISEMQKVCRCVSVSELCLRWFCLLTLINFSTTVVWSFDDKTFSLRLTYMSACVRTATWWWLAMTKTLRQPLVHRQDLPKSNFFKSTVFLSASLYVSKRGAYWDRLCRDVVGRWLVDWLVGCHARALWPNGAS